MEELQNSNPTILSAADLPSRLQSTNQSDAKSSSNGVLGILKPPVLADPFAKPLDLDGHSTEDESDDSQDELLEEPIDEQEIFGKQSNRNNPSMT